jgi:hypothetical protein
VRPAKETAAKEAAVKEAAAHPARLTSRRCRPGSG